MPTETESIKKNPNLGLAAGLLFNTTLNLLNHTTYLVVKTKMKTGYPDYLVILITILA